MTGEPASSMMRWWKRRLASEYSSRCSRSSPSSSNVENRSRRLRISSSLARSQSEPRGHALERGPGADHLGDLGLALAHDHHAAARHHAHEPLVLEARQRLAHGRAAHAQRRGEALLVQPQVGVGPVDVHARGSPRAATGRTARRRSPSRRARATTTSVGSGAPRTPPARSTREWSQASPSPLDTRTLDPRYKCLATRQDGTGCSGPNGYGARRFRDRSAGVAHARRRCRWP